MAQLRTLPPRRKTAAASPPAEAASADTEFVSAAARTLRLLEAFTSSESLLGNGELAERCEMPKSTVSRFTATLAQLGYLVLDPASQRYRLGAGVMRLGMHFMGARPLARLARPYMEVLASELRSPVAVAERDGLEMVYVDYCRGDAPVIIPRGPGSRVPLATSATGRAWLAAAAPVERDAVLAQLAARLGADANSATKDAIQKIDAAILEAQRNGYGSSYGEWVSEVNALAIAVRSPVNSTVLVFNVAAPAMLANRRRFEREFAPALKKMVGNVLAEMAADAEGME